MICDLFSIALYPIIFLFFSNLFSLAPNNTDQYIFIQDNFFENQPNQSINLEQPELDRCNIIKNIIKFIFLHFFLFIISIKDFYSILIIQKVKIIDLEQAMIKTFGSLIFGIIYLLLFLFFGMKNPFLFYLLISLSAIQLFTFVVMSIVLLGEKIVIYIDLKKGNKKRLNFHKKYNTFLSSLNLRYAIKSFISLESLQLINTDVTILKTFLIRQTRQLKKVFKLLDRNIFKSKTFKSAIETYQEQHRKFQRNTEQMDHKIKILTKKLKHLKKNGKHNIPPIGIIEQEANLCSTNINIFSEQMFPFFFETFNPTNKIDMSLLAQINSWFSLLSNLLVRKQNELNAHLDIHSTELSSFQKNELIELLNNNIHQTKIKIGILQEKMQLFIQKHDLWQKYIKAQNDYNKILINIRRDSDNKIISVPKSLIST